MKNVHNVMESLYKTAENIKKYLEANDFKYSFCSYNNHYIKINNKYVKQSYFIPVFTVSGLGDIGINLDGIFYEIIIHKKDISLNYIKNIISKFPNINIYGFDNCLSDFYKKGMDANKIFAAIKFVRKKKNMSRKTLGQNLGISRRKVLQYENGCQIIPMKILLKLFENGI